MTMYWWEPTEPYYPGAVLAEQAFGDFYLSLHVEQTNEGWHGLVFIDEGGDVPTPELVDEQVFDAKYDAVKWCEDRDVNRAAIVPVEEDDWSESDYWESVLLDDDEEDVD